MAREKKTKKTDQVRVKLEPRPSSKVVYYNGFTNEHTNERVLKLEGAYNVRVLGGFC
jgi:hypothetical protein